MSTLIDKLIEHYEEPQLILQHDYSDLVPDFSYLQPSTLQVDCSAYLRKEGLIHNTYTLKTTYNEGNKTRILYKHNGAFYSANINIKFHLNWNVTSSNNPDVNRIMQSNLVEVNNKLDNFMFAISRPDGIEYEECFSCNNISGSFTPNKNCIWVTHSGLVYIVCNQGCGCYKLYKCSDVRLEQESNILDISNNEIFQLLTHPNRAYQFIPPSNVIGTLKRDADYSRYDILCKSAITSCASDSQLKTLTNNLIKQNAPYRLLSRCGENYRDTEEIIFFSNPIMRCSKNPRFNTSWEVHFIY